MNDNYDQLPRPAAEQLPGGGEEPLRQPFLLGRNTAAAHAATLREQRPCLGWLAIFRHIHSGL